ncbi:gliding motility-associated C-terminal domain-containing protein [Mariniphaga sp.]|uniref:T9SS type B sorting domain-containing protein n=1 Tax=Mariniphaga sp. TaxID=1954475 RepID=UPI003562BFB7
MKYFVAFLSLLVLLILFSCEKEKYFRLSEDICKACDQKSLHQVGFHSIRIFHIITPNGDGINDWFVIHDIEDYKDSNISLSIFNRGKKQIANVIPDEKYNYLAWNGIPESKPDSDPQNGLYYYKLEIGDTTIEGCFLSLATYNPNNEYYDIIPPDSDCINLCSIEFSEDPMLFSRRPYQDD